LGGKVERLIHDLEWKFKAEPSKRTVKHEEGSETFPPIFVPFELSEQAKLIDASLQQLDLSEKSTVSKGPLKKKSISSHPKKHKPSRPSPKTTTKKYPVLPK
jgi:hypothetical protein